MRLFASRALSNVQETAQLLAGAELPASLLSSLLTGAVEVGAEIGVLNITPYDGWLEKTCLRWHINSPERRFRTLSVSPDVQVLQYSQKVCALELMEDGLRSCDS